MVSARGHDKSLGPTNRQQTPREGAALLNRKRSKTLIDTREHIHCMMISSTSGFSR